MSALGGPVKECSISGRGFKVKASSASGRSFGGMRNTVDPNGDGITASILQEVTPWSENLTVEIDDLREDQQFLVGIQRSGLEVDIQITYPGDVVFVGRGTIVDELVVDMTKASCELKLSGAGSLKRV